MSHPVVMGLTPDSPPASQPDGSPTSNHSRWRRDALIFALLLLSVLALASPTIARHVNVARSFSQINDDARVQIPPFLVHRHPERLRNDYTSQYLLNSYPIGFKAFYFIASEFKDPRWVSKVLPYPLWLAVTIFVGLAAKRLGGWGAAWVSMAIVVTAEVFIERMAGGLARSFAFPLLALAALALAQGRMYGLAGVVVLAAAFYPAAAVVAGIALAILLLLCPRKDRGDAVDWTLRKRLALLAGTVALCGVIYLPTKLATRQYGPLLQVSATADYPELGPHGRLGRRDRPPFPTMYAINRASMLTFVGPRRATGFLDVEGERAFYYARHYALLVLTLVAVSALIVLEPAGRRVFTLGIAAVVGHLLARGVHPHLYLPERYTIFTIPIVLAILKPAGLFVLARRLAPARTRLRNAALAGGFGLMLLAMGMGMRMRNHGLELKVQGSHPVMRFIEKQLPVDAVIAGWPAGLMDDVTYATKRQVFVNHEQHMVFHKHYADVMRDRTRALLQAYFATTPEPLVRLRDHFGVTHLVVDRRDYDVPPEYFAPYDAEIPRLFADQHRDGAEAVRQIPAIVFKDASFEVLDLSRLR